MEDNLIKYTTSSNNVVILDTLGLVDKIGNNGYNSNSNREGIFSFEGEERLKNSLWGEPEGNGIIIKKQQVGANDIGGVYKVFYIKKIYTLNKI